MFNVLLSQVIIFLYSTMVNLFQIYSETLSSNDLNCSPSGKPSGLQACMHTVAGTKREKIPTTKERGEHSQDRRAL